MEEVRKKFAEYKRLRQLHERPVSAERDAQVQEDAHDTAATGTTELGRTGDVDLHKEIHKDTNNGGETVNTPEAHKSADVRPDSPLPVPLYVTVLKALLWLLLWGFFVEVGFGAVYFITSLLYFIIVSLRGSRRRPWEPSAYSVFNKNFETIDGTLSAEQFERELRYGPLSVKKES